MERDVILAATFTLVILVIVIIIFFIIFQTKKNQYLRDKIEAEKKFVQEIEKSRSEIREQSLKNIAWELHDNVGQILSIAKMQLGLLERKLPEGNDKSNVTDIGNLIGDSLQEIRLLSKTLNAEFIHSLGLVEAVKLELERFNKLKFLRASLSVYGKEKNLEQKDEIIIFRILQEFFANVIKHSRADSLAVSLDYQPEKLLITAQDNGVGFDPQQISTGSGLLNMKSRAELMGLSYTIQSEKGRGVRLSVGYAYKKKITE